MQLLSSGAQALVVGASLSAAAAVAHLACVVVGAKAYRFMDAGERTARAVEGGRVRPALLTFTIAGVLLVWSAYALSGAGVVPALPLSRLALVLISLVYLARAVAFPLLKPSFPENSATFWMVSSSLCGLIGLLYTYGAYALWDEL